MYFFLSHIFFVFSEITAELCRGRASVRLAEETRYRSSRCEIFIFRHFRLQAKIIVTLADRSNELKGPPRYRPVTPVRNRSSRPGHLRQKI